MLLSFAIILLKTWQATILFILLKCDEMMK